MYWFAALPMDNIKNRIMADSITKPKYPSVLGAYRTVWRETFDPSKSLGWNALARVKNFYKVSVSVVCPCGLPPLLPLELGVAVPARSVGGRGWRMKWGNQAKTARQGAR